MKNFIKKNIRFVCDVEMESLKPGNVHKYSKSHDMTTKDFFRSSLIVSKYLSQNNLSLGKKIINTVMQIQKKIKKNTNLGIILMLAPIVVVVEKEGLIEEKRLLMKIKSLIKKQNVKNSFPIFKAISLRLGTPDPCCNIYLYFIIYIY